MGNQIVSGSLENTLEDKNLRKPPEVRLSRRNDNGGGDGVETKSALDSGYRAGMTMGRY